VPAAGTSPQAATAPQSQTQVTGSGSASQQLSSRDYGRTSPHGYGPWFGARLPRHGSFGFPSPFGRGPRH
jgi:hypothetical protein